MNKIFLEKIHDAASSFIHVGVSENPDKTPEHE
jgi:hypothetical protein